MSINHHMGLSQRFHGLLLIGYGLSPAILAVVAILLSLSIVNDIRGLLAGPLDSFGMVVAEIKESATKTGEAIGNVVDPIAKLNRKVNSALSAVSDIPTQVRVPALPIPDANLPVNPDVKIQGSRPTIQMRNVRAPMPTIPSFTLTIEGLKQVKTVLQDNFNIIGALNGIVEGIPNLNALRGEFQSLVDSTQQLISFMKSIGIKLLIIIILAVLIVAPWFYVVYVKPYFSWSFGYISRGWHLLQASPATACIGSECNK